MGEQNNMRVFKFEFTGQDAEYFRICMVNLLWVVLTLGLYLPRAIRQSRQFFYKHTQLNGVAFDYAVGAGQMPGSQLVMLFLLLGCTVLYLLLPGVEWLLSVMVLLLIPWLVEAGFASRVNGASYQKLSFYFSGDYAEALRVYVAIPVLVVLTAGILYPYLVYRNYHYVVENTVYGYRVFEFSANPVDFYNIYFSAFFFFLAPAAAFFASVSVLVVLGPVGLGFMAIMLLIVFCYVYAFIQSAKWSLFFQSLHLDGNRFDAEMDTLVLFKMYFINALAMLVSLGLLTPWAKMRLVRYRLASVRMRVADERAWSAVAQDSQRSAQEHAELWVTRGV